MWCRVTLITLLTIALSFPLAAQETGGELKQLGYGSKDVPSDQKLDIDFPGGTFIDLLALIEKRTGTTPNVIVSKEAGMLPLPAFSLCSVSVKEVILALENLSEIEGFYIRTGVNKGSHVITVTARRQQQTVSYSPRRSSKVYNLEKVLSQKCNIADVITAIQTAWEMISEQHSAVVRFHKETNLLIAVGTNDELQIVHDIVLELLPEESVDERAGSLDQLKAEIQTLKAWVEKLSAESKELKEAFEKIKTKKF